MSFLLIVLFTSMLIHCNVHAQRSPYAGARPASGYKDTYLPQGTSTTTTVGGGVVNSVIGNRDGENGPTQGSTSTERLPYDAHGDAYLVNHYNNLPIDQRPFWIVNQQHIEAHRGTPPQTGSTSQFMTNRPTVVDRIDDNGQQNNLVLQQQRPQQPPPQQQPPPPQQQWQQLQPQPQPQQPLSPVNNQNNMISLQEIVYPSNVTPEQRLNMEIQFLQQRLEILLERRRQLQAQNGQQSTVQQAMPNQQNLQNSQNSNMRNFQ